MLPPPAAGLDPRRSPALRPFAARARRAGVVAVALLLLALCAPPEAHAARYQKGEVVQFTGLVTRGDGTPIEGVQVLLEAQRKTFDFRRLGKTQVDQFRVSTTTDARGEYAIRWPWNDYYNGFELLVAIPVRRAGAEKLRVLTRTDVTARVDDGSPIVTPIVMQDTSFLDTFRRFLAALDSADEKRVYEQQGRPDKVEDTGPGQTAWWYFDRGKVYRFRDGRLTETGSFDPIQPIEG